jgi:uncharacterized protein YyaL (SSP411 family)
LGISFALEFEPDRSDVQSTTSPSSLSAILDAKPDQSSWRYYVRTHDARYGGFSPAAGQSTGPKFPSSALTLEPLSRFAVLPPRRNESDKREQARQMAVHMTRCMWEGRIHDWAREGFARYSDDEEWRVAHFEKTLWVFAAGTRTLTWKESLELEEGASFGKASNTQISSGRPGWQQCRESADGGPEGYSRYGIS